MMETLQEQILYGSYCQHGTALGTPGGADLICGMCENGFNRWVMDPQYALFVGLEMDTEVHPGTRATLYWSASEPISFRRLYRIVRRYTGLIELGLTPHYTVEQIASGYWAETPRRFT